MSRRLCWALVVGGGVTFVVLAAVLVPWDPVPGGTPAPASAEQYFTAAELERAETYARTARLLSWGSLGLSLLVSCWLGFTRLGARLPGARLKRWSLSVTTLVASVVGIGWLVTLPLDWLLHRHRVDAGLSTQSTGEWLADQLKGLGLAVVVTAIALLVLVACARRWRRSWPAAVAGIFAVLVVLGSFIYPLAVEPLFNRFEPMTDSPLRDRIFAVADAEHVDIEDVLVADASRRTTTLNAYVSGFGGTRRVVLYDTLLESASDGEVLSVVAHELSHARHADVLRGTALGAVGTVFGVGLLGLLTPREALRRRAGVTGFADPRAVALLLAMISLGGLVSSPIENAMSRRVETRADVDALKATGDPVAFRDLQVTLCVRSLCDPSPPALSQFWFGSHPTVLSRISLTRTLASD